MSSSKMKKFIINTCFNVFLVFCFLVLQIQSSHFRGGIITWKQSGTKVNSLLILFIMMKIYRIFVTKQSGIVVSLLIRILLSKGFNICYKQMQLYQSLHLRKRRQYFDINLRPIKNHII